MDRIYFPERRGAEWQFECSHRRSRGTGIICAVDHWNVHAWLVTRPAAR
jgi:hypothetical protein